MAAAISPFYEPTEPSQPMMSDDVNDEDRPQHRELRPLLFSNSQGHPTGNFEKKT